MIPMEYLRTDAKSPSRLNPGAKSGESTNKNNFIKHKSSESKRKLDIGPAVVLHIGESAKLEPMRAYDFLGRPKEM
jgi:hypothetical protein